MFKFKSEPRTGRTAKESGCSGEKILSNMIEREIITEQQEGSYQVEKDGVLDWGIDRSNFVKAYQPVVDHFPNGNNPPAHT